jgi:hypothetical protein
MIGALVIETCSQGHKFGKLMPDHPLKDGKARCPICMAEGLDWANAQLASHGKALSLLENENKNLRQTAGHGNH